MRGHQEDDSNRPRPIFSRSADGRLRAGSNEVAAAPQRHIQPLQHHAKPGMRPIHVQQPEAASTDDVDVGDIWSEQERIRLQEGWEESQRKEERKRRRREMFRKKLTGVSSENEQVVRPGSTPRSGPPVLAAATAEPASTEAKEITLNISMPSIPKMTLPKLRIPAMPRISKKRAMLLSGIAVVMIAGGAGYGFYQKYSNGHAPAIGDDGKTETMSNGVRVQHLDPAKQTGKPDYDTLLPAGKKIEDFGGWVRISPPEKNPVYAYADKIDDVLINVSEQPLPATFKKDTDTAMDDLAAQYSANDKIKVGTVTAYIGTSIKGPQSVLLVKQDVLILMKSASKIPDNHWETYIRSLQ